MTKTELIKATATKAEKTIKETGEMLEYQDSEALR